MTPRHPSGDHVPDRTVSRNGQQTCENPKDVINFWLRDTTLWERRVAKEGSFYPPAEPPAELRAAKVRVLATSDVHMQLLGHAYATDQPLPHRGLSGLATIIAQERAKAAAEGAAVLLVDNGDLLQGNALGTWAASHRESPLHPVAAILNLMNYDAVGVGNHDLDFGLSYLTGLARDLQMPMVSSNLVTTAPDPLQPHAVLPCAIPHHPDETINIGILSVLPEQTAMWNRAVLGQDARIAAILPAAEEV